MQTQDPTIAALESDLEKPFGCIACGHYFQNNDDFCAQQERRGFYDNQCPKCAGTAFHYAFR